MESLLRPFDPSKDDASDVLYSGSTGQKYMCPDPIQLSTFLAESLLHSDENHQLYVDWLQCRTHPLLFRIDAYNLRGVPTHQNLLYYFDNVFLPAVENHLCLPDLLVVLSMRRRGKGGLLVHLLDVQLHHDDYVFLCRLIQEKCFFTLSDVTFYLACPSTAYLVASDAASETGGLFLPTLLIHKTCAYDPLSGNSRIRVDKVTLHREPSRNTLFRALTHRDDRERFVRAACLTMPVPSPCSRLPRDPTRYLEFATRIVPETDPPEAWAEARFQSCLNQRFYRVVKDTLLSNGDPGDAFVYRFLKNHARCIDSFETSNPAMAAWYARFSTLSENARGALGRLDRDLVRKCPHWKGASRPLDLLLKSRAWHRPAYYALRNLLTETVETDRGREPSPPAETTRLSFRTLWYCAIKSLPTGTPDSLFIRHVWTGWDWIFESKPTLSEMMRHIQWIQQWLFPVVKGSVDRKVNVYSWDPFVDQWCRVTEKNQIETVLLFVYGSMTFAESFPKLPKELLTALRDQWEWLNDLVNALWNDLQEAQPIVLNPLKMSQETMSLAFGTNVPEYYFVKPELEDVAKGKRTRTTEKAAAMD